MAQLSNQRSSCNNFHVMSLTSSSSTTRTQLHYYTSCYISNITPQQTCTRWATSQLSIPYFRSSSSLSLRSDKPVAAIVSIFPFPLHQQKKHFVVLLLALSTCFLFTCSTFLSIHVLNCTVMLYHLILFPFTCFFFQSLKSRGRSSLSKGSMLGTVVYASRPRKFIPLYTLAAPYTIVLFLIFC